jgi:hypothetical protein
MTSIDFGIQEKLLATLEKDAKERRDRAVRLRQEAQQLDKDSYDTLKVRSEYLKEVVTAELVRRNLSCCGYCGKVTNEITVCKVYESSDPAWFTIWRLCGTCQKARRWEFPPQVISLNEDMTANKLLCLCIVVSPRLLWRNLSQFSAEEAFRQLKEIAEHEEPRRDDILRYHIND